MLELKTLDLTKWYGYCVKFKITCTRLTFFYMVENVTEGTGQHQVPSVTGTVRGGEQE